MSNAAETNSYYVMCLAGLDHPVPEYCRIYKSFSALDAVEQAFTEQGHDCATYQVINLDDPRDGIGQVFRIEPSDGYSNEFIIHHTVNKRRFLHGR